MSAYAAALLGDLTRTSVGVSILAAAVWLLLRSLRCKSPSVHRTAWCAVLLSGCVLLRPAVVIPWYSSPRMDARSSPTRTSEVLESPMTGTAAQHAANAMEHRSADTLWEVERAPGALHVPTWTMVLVALWIVGMLLIVLRWVVKYRRFSRRIPLGYPLQEEWQQEWNGLLTEAAIRHPVRLVLTEGLGPLVCRAWDGYLLLAPIALWQTLSSRERCAVLRHELAHLSRGDILKSLLARCLALPHWFNPVCWWAVRNFDECGEWACDDAVRRDSPADLLAYSRVLLRLGQATERPVLSTAVGGGPLSKRLRRILNGPIPEDSSMKKSVVVGIIGALLFAVAIDWQLGSRDANAVQQEVAAERRRLNVDPIVIQEMVSTAAKTFEATKASYDVGTEMMANVYVWSRRWLDAERDLAETDAEELAALKAHRRRMKQLMMKVRALYLAGSKGGEAEKYFATKFYLAEADAWLAAAKNRSKAGPVSLKKVTISFRGPKGLVVQWDEQNQGKFDSETLTCPGSHEFVEGRLYFLQFRGVGEVKLNATLDLTAASEKPMIVELGIPEIKKAASGHTLSKVYFQSKESGLEVASDWDDLRDEILIETERNNQVLGVLHVGSAWW